MATTVRHTATLALAHALSAAERGLPVIPLSPTKLPALRSPHRGGPEPSLCRGECGRPGHGVHDATTDPAEVRALFAAAPWATGYGIACGRPPHQLIGIDLDIGPAYGAAASDPLRGPVRDPPRAPAPDSVAALQHLAFQHLFTLPETVVVLTPSGGRHIWLTGPPNVVVPSSAGRLAPGIDVRGAGGYLVGPGSVTARGAYRLAPGTAGLAPAPCPRALLRLLTPPAGPRHAKDRPARGHGLVQFVLAAHEGQRNTRLFWAACRAYEHGFGDALAEALVDAAVRTGLNEHEARATIASAARLTSRL
ncbi:bifunctional DNA primase/polymerase [Streptomyces sp. JV176]|uniref:bifunctional DNA primase/polymerase n=1 Tax=Streptomyces sp. JV176 TaxID=858630 RepID=UPI002E76B548|nr:bifunctional DNA primase/polymerase [Streptomyces sp. JV176]MEE1803582.1 bifunctional DNA primase/polymerase [Streptomyces sp. JV176]